MPNEALQLSGMRGGFAAPLGFVARTTPLTRRARS
jgi:hypothetical protein